MKQKLFREAWTPTAVARATPYVDGFFFTTLFMLTLALIEIANEPGHEGGPPYIDLPRVKPPWSHGEWHTGNARLKYDNEGRLHYAGGVVPPGRYHRLFERLARENGELLARQGNSGWTGGVEGGYAKLRLILYVDRGAVFGSVAEILRAAAASGIYAFKFRLVRGSITVDLPRGPRSHRPIRRVDTHFRMNGDRTEVLIDSVPVGGNEAMTQGPGDHPLVLARFRVDDDVPLEDVLRELAARRTQFYWYEIVARGRGWRAPRPTPQPIDRSTSGPR